MTISDNDSLLSFVVLQHTQGPEDAVTDALRFILSRSPSTMATLSEFLKDEDGPLPIAEARTWTLLDSAYAYPDMALYDAAGKLTAFIESKFWASLTHNQPVTYWEALPTNRRSVLLFLAPRVRVDEGYLWNELVDKLRDDGHELSQDSGDGDIISASAKNDHRRLMLTSWEYLLGLMRGRAEREEDTQAAFEVAELQSLARGATEGGSPVRGGNLIALIEEAGKRLQHSGWADSGSQNVGSYHRRFYGRFMMLAGAYVWLGIVDKAAKYMPNPPLWLTIQPSGAGQLVGRDEVLDKLGNLVESRTEWHDWMTHCVSIPLLSGADREGTLNAIVSELESIAKIIDPDGPTYR